ncbi:MAG: hypothetical protein M0R46_08930 [Candidatus Muirbacterium halophilum]|nr:hypothetical protein [Candidatus Muirbacterium halophilum]MCK9476029.1 hypothetical protein [Candidatus Muirbacterium halophilum]
MRNNKGFVMFFAIFFMIIIFAFTMFYNSRVRNSGKNMERELGKVMAEKIAEEGIYQAYNIIYENYAKGNRNFATSLSYPIELKSEFGEIKILDINYYSKDDTEFIEMYNFYLNNINGKFDIFKIKCEGKSEMGEKVCIEEIIKVQDLSVLR